MDTPELVHCPWCTQKAPIDPWGGWLWSHSNLTGATCEGWFRKPEDHR
jgi:hypothetical protein